jgi:hypothetical protein
MVLECALPPPPDEILFETELRSTAFSPAAWRMRKEMGEGMLTTLQRNVNTITVYAPYCENLISRYMNRGIDLPGDTKKMMDTYDFHFLSFSCSIFSDSDVTIAWARFGLELSAQSASGTPVERPIALDMAPHEVMTSIIVKGGGHPIVIGYQREE